MINFNRKIGLLIADAGGEALDLSGFRVIFEVAKTGTEAPNTAKIDIYNLAPTTAQKILSGEMKRIVLQAGYESNFGVLFDGGIMASTMARNGTDTILSIEAGDGDEAYSYAVVTQAIASGYKQSDIAGTAVSTLKEKGTRTEDVESIDKETVYPRGRTLFGSTRSYARELAKTSDCQWSIQDGQVVFCKVKKTPKGRVAFLLTPKTGLIGSPTVDKDGLKAVCCLNPQLSIYDPLVVESEFVKGTYKIVSVTHKGDNFGTTWTTEVDASVMDTSQSETTQR